MITAPVIDLLRGSPNRQYRTGRAHHLVEQLPGGPGRPDDLTGRDGEPLVQSAEAIAAGVAGFVVRTSDVPVE